MLENKHENKDGRGSTISVNILLLGKAETSSCCKEVKEQVCWQSSFIQSGGRQNAKGNKCTDAAADLSTRLSKSLFIPKSNANSLLKLLTFLLN